MKLLFCPVCGGRLERRALPGGGDAAYCGACGEYRFPIFSTAVSVIVLSPDRERMILIRQYGEAENVLVAGYVDKGERAEAAAVREVKEELGMTVRSLQPLQSHYYAPSETLMLNFAATVEETEARPNWEVDGWDWVPVGQAMARVRPGGLAARLLADYPPARDGEPAAR